MSLDASVSLPIAADSSSEGPQNGSREAEVGRSVVGFADDAAEITRVYSVVGLFLVQVGSC